jgi:hypothetical protein
MASTGNGPDSGTDADFGEGLQASCGQVEVERHHDGLDKDSDPKTYIENLTESLTPECADFFTTNPPEWTDPKFLRYIFNTPTTNAQSKDHIRQLGNTTHTITYKSQGNIKSSLPYSNANGQIFNFDNVDDQDQQGKANIQRIIRAMMQLSGAAADTPLYIFIDTGHQLIEQFSRNPLPQGHQAVLNVINSQVTFADGCKNGKSLYNTNIFRFGSKLQCWWYQKNIIVPPYGDQDNYMFHTNLYCQLGDEGEDYPGSLLITQIWAEAPGKPVVNITNASDQNTITKINDFFPSNNSMLRSVGYQRKRSGDGFQIWFINKFADELKLIASAVGAPPQSPFFCTCLNGNKNEDAGTPVPPGCVPLIGPVAGLSPQQAKIEIRKRSYFVTIDWAAFCWAAFCNINVLFVSAAKFYPKTNFQLRQRVMLFKADENRIVY